MQHPQTLHKHQVRIQLPENKIHVGQMRISATLGEKPLQCNHADLPNI